MIVTCGELRAIAAHLYVPGIGPWWIDLDFDSEVSLAEKVKVVLTGTAGAPLVLTGSIDPERSGTFGLQRHVRVIAGGNGWSKALPSKSYHNDAGVRASRVAGDAAKETGETLATAPTGTLGTSFTREAGVASTALDASRGSLPWFVDFDGLTHVAARASSKAAAGLAALSFDPKSKLVTLPLEDPNLLKVGTILSERLDSPEVVASFEFHVTSESARAIAWCGQGRSYLADSFERAVKKISSAKLHGIYSYRVTTMVGVRVSLKATAPGLPDLAAVDEWTAPGIHAQLVPGSEALVQFVNGDRGRPVIVGFSPKGKAGAVPVVLELGDAASAVARVGDTVTVYFPPVVTGTATIAGTPSPIVLNMANLTSVGIIQSGNPKVKA